jgi:phage gpG-like protein
VRITLDVFGDVQLDRQLLRFQEAFSDLSPAFEVLADDFLTVNKRQFDSEGGNSGTWAPLAPATVRRRGSAHPILNEHGDLRESLTQRGGKGSVRTVGPHELFVGTDVDYAHFHQSGTSRMPRRRPVELTAADRTRWVKSLQRFVTTGEPGL